MSYGSLFTNHVPLEYHGLSDSIVLDGMIFFRMSKNIYLAVYQNSFRFVDSQFSADVIVFKDEQMDP